MVFKVLFLDQQQYLGLVRNAPPQPCESNSGDGVQKSVLTVLPAGSDARSSRTRHLHVSKWGFYREGGMRDKGKPGSP